MNSVKYVGLDVHKETISAAVLDGEGRLMMQSVLATNARAILDFVQGLRGTIHLTLEEGTHSRWLHGLLSGRVERVVVCDPRKDALLKAGSKNDAIDAGKLAELRANLVKAVYHADNGLGVVQQLGRSYTTLTEDTTRVMGRLKAIYRGQAVAEENCMDNGTGRSGWRSCPSPGYGVEPKGSIRNWMPYRACAAKLDRS
jgi:hypothetical protein